MSDETCEPKKEQLSSDSGANGDRSGSPGAGGSNENGSGRDREDVCRDFLKNICNRGSRCKFFHPADSKQRTEDTINFCIDFQVCMRLSKLLELEQVADKRPEAKRTRLGKRRNYKIIKG